MNTTIKIETATRNLEDDHVHILRLTDVMEHLTTTTNPVISHLESIVEIIRNFADGIHHAKEEDIFFPLLSQKGFSSTQGPVAVMLNEHLAGRNFVRGMAENIELYKNGNKDALGRIYYNMKGYVELLRAHISKENNILFRMADRVLSEKDHTALLAKFVNAENLHSSPSGYIKRIEDLSSYYNI